MAATNWPTLGCSCGPATSAPRGRHTRCASTGGSSSQPTLKDFAASIDFAVDDRWLDKPLLTTFAGTTGAEGPAALKGQVKPLALGAPRYVSGTLIDSINSVFQVSGYGAVNGFEAALEKLARYNAPTGDFASYAALVAATIPRRCVGDGERGGHGTVRRSAGRADQLPAAG